MFGPERDDDDTDFCDMPDHDAVTEIINAAIAEAQRLREAKREQPAQPKPRFAGKRLGAAVDPTYSPSAGSCAMPDIEIVVDLPVIEEFVDDFDTPLDQARRALIRQGKVYRRGRFLVVPDGSMVAKTRYGDKPHLAIHQLDAVGLERLLVHATHLSSSATRSGQAAADSAGAHKLLHALLGYFGAAPMGLPALKGVMRAPFLRRDGSVCTNTGFDSVTGIYFDPGGEYFPSHARDYAGQRQDARQGGVPASPAAPLRGYRFDSSTMNDDGTWNHAVDTGRAVLVSTFLTVLAVSATRTRPATLVDAPTFGSGKTMATELAVMMMIGDDPALIPVPDKGASDELDKQIDACLLSGRGYIILDNARGDLARSTKIVALLTATKTGVRIFHTQGDIEVESPALFISGNNAEANDDLGRRLSRCRIDTQHERPDEQAFDFDPRAEVLHQRGQMAIDALTIMRAYVVAGRPVQGGRAYGSFEEWARLVRDPLTWLGLPDIVLSNDEQRDDDPETAKLDALLDAWRAANFADDLHFTCVNLIKTITPEPDKDREYESRPTLALYRACLDVAGQPPGSRHHQSERLEPLAQNKHKDRRRNGPLDQPAHPRRPGGIYALWLHRSAA